MVPSRQGGAEAPRPTGGSPWPSIVHASGSAATREPRRYARRRGSWPPRGLSGPADSRPPRGGRRARRGGPCATRPGRGGRPGQGVPERAGGCASRTGRRATWPASARRRASARVRPCADTACRGTGARRPAGPRGAGAGTSGTGRAPSDWAMLGCGDCLAALSAAESAEVACDGPGAKAEGVARASDPGPPVDTPVRARDRVPPRPRALGELERREPEAGPHPGERLRARAQASHRGCLGPRAGQPGVPQGGRNAGVPRDLRARAGLLGKAPRTSQGAGLPRPGTPRGQHRHGRRDGAHAASRRQGRAGGRRAGRGEVRAARAAVSADMGLRAGTSVSQRSFGTQVRICHRRLTRNFREAGHCLLTVFGSYEGHC